MKVKTIDVNISSAIHPRPQKRENIQGLNFAQMLIEAKEKAEGPRSIDPGNPFDLRSRSLKSLEEALTTIERYQEGLSSPETSLRVIEPIVHSLAEEMEDLESLSHQLPAEDPLRRIMIEAAVLSAVEIEKFRRGDYL